MMKINQEKPGPSSKYMQYDDLVRKLGKRVFVTVSKDKYGNSQGNKMERKASKKFR